MENLDMEQGKAAQGTRSIVRRAGWAIIALGLVDLVFGIAYAAPGVVSLKIGALLVGLLILFGGMRVHAVVRWLGLLGMGAWLPGILLTAFVVPIGLTLTQMRLYPLAFAASCIPGLVWLGVAGIAALGLGHPLLLAARAHAGKTIHNARIPLVLGLLLALGTSYLQLRVLGGEAGERAIRIAAGQLGPGYRYYTNSLNATIGTPTRYSATVQAWNENEVRTVAVRWQD